MASSGWSGIVSQMHDQHTPPHPRKNQMGHIHVAESTPFVVPTDSDMGDMDEDDIDDEQLLSATSLMEEEEDEVIEDKKVLFQVQAVGEYQAQEEGDLSFKAGEILQILESSRDDGWFLAENALGQQGVIPGNHVQKLTDNESRLITPSGKNSMEKRGKDLWTKLRSNVKQTSLADVLSALGAVPAGFRESTLHRLLNESNEYHTSTWIFPRLNLTGMAFKDIRWDYTKDQLHPKLTTVNREFIIIGAKMIPLPGKGMQVLSRHVRIAFFNKNEILSNIHTIRAVWNPQEEKTWKFLPKNLTNNNSLFHRVGIARTDLSDPNIELLFELAITFKREKTGQIGEFSCGWSSLPLYHHTGAQTSNKTYELKLHGGTPFESGVEVDPALGIKASGGRVPSIMKRNQTPRLYVQLVTSTRETKTDCSLLPSTLVTSQQYLKAIGCFRQQIGQAFLSNRMGLPIPSYVNQPSLDIFLKAVDQPDVMDSALDLWRQQLRTTKRSDRASFSCVTKLLERVLLEHIYPLLYSVNFQPYLWADDQREKERSLVIDKYSRYQGNSALLANDVRPKPLNVAEQIFKIYP